MELNAIFDNLNFKATTTVNNLKKMNPQTVFLIIGLIYGIGFLVVTPPFQVPDEYEHFYRSLYLSEGHIIPEKLGDQAGVYIPDSVQITTDAISQQWHFYITYREKLNIVPLLDLPYNSKDRVFSDISRIAVITYPPVPYLISAFGITFGKLFNLSPLLLMYIGRFTNLLVFIFLIYMAIRITPVHKWVFLMLSLMPMTLFEASSLSADSFTIGLSLLAIAILFKFSFDAKKKEIKLKDIYIIFLVILLVALSKQVYFLLLFLIFLIPVNKFGTRIKMFLTFILMFIPILLVSVGWNFVVENLYMPIIPQVSIKSQLFFVLSDPLSFPYALINSLLHYGLSYQFLFVGNFWLDTPLPIWWLGSYLLGLIPVSLMDKSNIKIYSMQKIVSFITLILIFVAVCLFIYLSWTPVGQNTIEGIQGRYFIPIAPLLFLLLSNKRKSMTICNRRINLDVGEDLNLAIILYTIIFLSITLFIFITNYYI